LERAILYNSRGNTATVGFQHLALSRNFLNYVFCDGELGDHWRRRHDAASTPLPDFILTSGEKGIHYMQKAGYPQDHLAIGGAIRLRRIKEYGKEMPSKELLRKRYNQPLNKKIILVTPSPLLEETSSMIEALFGAVKDRPSDFHVVIKCHPNALRSPGYVSGIRKVIDRKGIGITTDLLTSESSLYDYMFCRTPFCSQEVRWPLRPCFWDAPLSFITMMHSSATIR
jgi:hypothetical protein